MIAAFSPFTPALWLGFSLCLALTVLGVLTQIRMSGRRQYEGLAWLQYGCALLAVFGFYGIWSRILLFEFLPEERAGETGVYIAGMGLPFLVLGQILVLVWLLKQGKRLLKHLLALLACGWLVLGVLLLMGRAGPDFITAMTAGSGVVFLVGAGYCLLAASGLPKGRAQPVFLGGFAGTGVFYVATLLQPEQDGFIALILAVLFFLSHTLVLVTYLYHSGRVSAPESFECLLARFDVTRREAQVVQGIFEGKTNQEIADTLFISLQTVKDHSSSIYQKTRVRNRTQLAALLREALSQAR